MKRSAGLVLSLLLAVAAVLVAPTSASAHPYCGIRWGSLPKTDRDMSTAEVVGARAGRHACFDRFVIDAEGDMNGYYVRYVDQVRQDGSGFVVPVRGGARLEVIATAGVAPSDSMFTGAGRDVVNVSGYRTFRQAVYAGSFEGQTTFGLGVRARLPFRVFLLDGPGAGSRLVVDVAHRW